jgi:hypothetical protein
LGSDFPFSEQPISLETIFVTEKNDLETFFIKKEKIGEGKSAWKLLIRSHDA